VLVYWGFHAGGFFICPAPFLWGRVNVPSAGPCYQRVIMVPCFAILQGSLTLGAAHWLAQEMNFVICYLP
jgi:hypothetical protein